jgi:hypothetical protein
MRFNASSPGPSRCSAALLAIAAVLLVSAARAASPFVIAALPDTQYYSLSFPDTFTNQTQWIVDHRQARNIVFVTHLGDITETASPQEFANATAAMYRLDGAVRWGTCPGNHDIGGDPYAQYLTHFGPAHFAGQGWYGGDWGASSCQYFEGGGRTFLALHLEYHPPQPALSWAQGVLAAHSALPTIVVTHDSLGQGGRGAYGDGLWEDLIRINPQVFMVLNGHTAGEFHQVSTNEAGQAVFELLSDYQFYPDGGEGYLRLMEFDEDAGRIRIRTYSPLLDLYETDTDSQFEFSLDFQERFGPVPEPLALLMLAPALMLLRRRR